MVNPKKFANLHAHDGKSIYDGFGDGGDHIQFAADNGMSSMAMTNHGNMNSFPECYQKTQELNKNGRPMKFIPGVEAYYIPSLKDWAAAKVTRDQVRKEEREAAKVKRPDNDEDDTGVAVEDEDASKRNGKYLDPVERRHHLVLLPKSQKGLENIFRLVSRSAREGYYRFPRIDSAMLKEHGEDVVVSTACVAGVPSWATYSQFAGKSFDELTPDILDEPGKRDAVMRAVGNEFDRLTDAVGRDNVFAEIQFNRLAPQHLTNRVLLEFAKSNGVKLVATADSHYCSPDLWRAREVYKLLGRMGRGGSELGPDSIPADVKQLKCELYPKNADQMWDAYNLYKEGHAFYDDAVVAESIENAWHVAHDVIGDVTIDTSVKLPSFGVRPDMTPFQTLVESCKEGMRAKRLAHLPAYVARLKNELSVIKKLDNSIYFLTLKAILDVAKKDCLVGPGRGSGAGSLVNFVLGITDVDPVSNNLIFARFMSLARTDVPDIDCLDARHLIMMTDGSYKRIETVEKNDVVIDIEGAHRKVLTVNARSARKDEIIYELLVKQDSCYGTIVCNAEHKMVLDDNTVVRAKQLLIGHSLKGSENCVVVGIIILHGIRTLVDIEVEHSHTFRVIPFDVYVDESDPRLGDVIIKVNDYLDVDEVSK